MREFNVEIEPTIKRETEVEATPEEVWEAITDEASLESWLGEEVTIEPAPGGEIRVRDDDGERAGEILFVREGERLTFSWAREGENPTFVEFEVVRIDPRRTALRVTETAPAWAPSASALMQAGEAGIGSQGGPWAAALARLVRAMDLVCA